jgi:hypothetical protein
MNILFTGRGGAGSWTIRAEQIGAALGARVKALASREDCEWADVIVVVKRLPPDLLTRIRWSRKPWVYDVVDAYPQPQCGTWDRARSVQWLAETEGALRPNRMIWPNKQMQVDATADGWPVIYHHHRLGIRRNPIRERVARIGYEGAASYLDGWMPAIERECRRIGAEFVLNPSHLADVDVVLALRDKNHAGYPQRAWKSNVKLANAHGSGTPFIGMPEPGYQETATGAEYWATSAAELGNALDWLAPQETRRSVSEKFLAAALPVEKVAAQYREFLCGLKS